MAGPERSGGLVIMGAVSGHAPGAERGRMTAIIEVQSHLEVCELRGEVTRTRVDGVDLYQLR